MLVIAAETRGVLVRPSMGPLCLGELAMLAASCPGDDGWRLGAAHNGAKHASPDGVSLGASLRCPILGGTLADMGAFVDPSYRLIAQNSALIR